MTNTRRPKLVDDGIPDFLRRTPIAEPSEQPSEQAPGETISIAKPSAFSLDKFKSKQTATLANVETLLAALPHHSISQAKDFVRLHAGERYWSPELCFVNVPIQGAKRDTLHLIEEDLAMRYLPSGRILRFRLALAARPGKDKFFLGNVPTRNQDNAWNTSNLEACERAKHQWIIATSRREEGVEGYKVDAARDVDAFAAPEWPTQTLEQLIEKTFAGRMIDREDHPALLRLIGARQPLT